MPALIEGIRFRRASPRPRGWSFLDAKGRDDLFDQLRQTLPARRIGSPRDLAQAALAPMTNPFVTGTLLHCDDGAHLA